MSNAVKVFFSYSHEDEALRDKLANHLITMKRQGVIEAWHDREISAGSESANVIDDNLNVADIILLLVSANFMASDDCYDIVQRAMVRHETRKARVIPIILRPTDWNGEAFGKLQALPKNAKPVTTWQDQDEAFLNVAQEIRRVVEDIAKSKLSSLTASGTTTPATSSPLATSGGLTERQRRRLEQERDSLQQQYDLASTKLARLGQAYYIETDVLTKLKLEAQIQESKTEQNKLDQQLQEIEQQIAL
jgi:TIR domain/Effector-associated domain 9